MTSFRIDWFDLLNKIKLFLAVLEAGKFKIEVLADFGVWREPISWFIGGRLFAISLAGRKGSRAL